MFSTRLFRPLTVAAFAAGLVAGSPANATDLAKVVGTGTISPGLPASGCAPGQSVSFDGTAVLVGTHAGTYDVHFGGTSSICESLGAGQGCGELSGDITSITLVCYSRTENVVTLSGTVSVQGQSHNIQAGVCEFAPTTVNPVQSYALTCQLVLL